MPSYSIDLRDPQTILRILTVLVEQAGGELKFRAERFDGLDKAKLLMVDYNRKKGVISLRVTTDFGSAVSVQPEAHQWTLPAQNAPLERARTEATEKARKSHVPSDEELADLEEKMKRNQQLSMLDQEGKAPLRIKTVS